MTTITTNTTHSVQLSNLRTSIWTLFRPLLTPNSLIIVGSLAQKNHLTQDWLTHTPDAACPDIVTLDDLVVSHRAKPLITQEGLAKWALKTTLSEIKPQTIPLSIWKSSGFGMTIFQYIRQRERYGVTTPSDYPEIESAIQAFGPAKKKVGFEDIQDYYVESLSADSAYWQKFVSNRPLILFGFFDVPQAMRQFMALLKEAAPRSDTFVMDTLPTVFDTGHVSITKYPNPQEEWHGVVAQLKDLAHSGAALSEITVILPDLQDSLLALEPLLQHYGIPYTLPVGKALLDTGRGQCFRDFLSVVQFQNVAAVTRFFQSPIIQDKPLEDRQSGLFLAQISRIVDQPTPGTFASAIKETFQYWVSEDTRSQWRAEWIVCNGVIEEYEQIFGNQRMTHEARVSALQMVYADVRVNALDVVQPGVKVMGPRAAFGARTTHLLMPRFTATSWGIKDTQTLFMSPESAKSVGIPGLIDRLRDHEMIFAALLHSAKHVHVSYPKKSGDGPIVRHHYCDQYLSNLPIQEGRGVDKRFSGQLTLAASRPEGIDVINVAYPTELPSLNHQLQANDLRQKGGLTNPYTGYVPDASPSQPNPVYRHSPTELELYQRCPQRYYLQKVLGVRSPKRDADLDLQSVWGSVVHHFFMTLFRQRIAINRDTLPAIHQVAQDSVKSYSKRPSMAALFSNWFLGLGEQTGLIEQLITGFEGRPYPIDQLTAETPFGEEGSECAIALPNGSIVELHGQIDAVLGDSKGFIIVDFKTGESVPKLSDVKSGASLQLPLYLLAYSRITPNLEPLGAMIYQLHPIKGVREHLYISTKEAKKEVFEAGRKQPQLLDDQWESVLLHQLSKCVDSIHSGAFSPMAWPELEPVRKSACSYCPYSSACRYDKRFEGFRL